MTKIKYSWILPINNEAESLPQLLNEIKQVMRSKSYEIIAINDASTDNSLTTLTSLIFLIPLKIINFPSPQGKWAALLAGFKSSKGKIIITSDSDLQDNPQEVTKLLQKLDQGYDLVSGWRKVRHDPLYKVLISNAGNWLASSLTGYKFYDLNSPFKIYKREIIHALPIQGSMLRFSMFFAQKMNFKVIEVPVNHRARLYGKSKFKVIKHFRIIYDLILVLLLFSGSGRLTKKG